MKLSQQHWIIFQEDSQRQSVLLLRVESFGKRAILTTFPSKFNTSEGISTKQASRQACLNRQSRTINPVLPPSQSSSIATFTVASHRHIVRHCGVGNNFERGILVDGDDFAAAAGLGFVAVAWEVAIRFFDLYCVDRSTAVT